MPRLSLTGRVTHMGPGAGPKRCFLTATQTAEQACAPVCELVARDVVTGVTATLDGRGANWLDAGGGVWAARLQDGSGYRDALGRTHPDWMPLAVDADGTVLLSSYSTGRGLSLLTRTGDVVPIADVLLDVQQADIDRGVVVWRSGGLMHRRTVDGAVSSLPALSDARYCDGVVAGGGPGGLWAGRWDDPSRALLLHAGEQDFNPDVCTLDSGLVRVVSARTAGEAPGDIQVYDINFVLGTVNGTARAYADLRHLPVPPASDVPRPDLPVLAQPRATWRGLCGGGPGNCVWGVINESDARPIIEGLPWASDAGDRLRWLFFPCKDFNPTPLFPTIDRLFEATVALAKARRIPVVAYWDGATYEGRPWAKRFVDAGCEVLRGVQAYPHYELGERGRPDLTLERINAVLTGHGPYRDWIIGPVYDYSGAWDVADVYAVNTGIDLLIQAHTHVLGDTRFGRGRGTCYDIWPDMQTYWAELCRRTPTPHAASPKPSVPAPPPHPTPVPTPEPPPMPPPPDLDALVNRAMPAWAQRFLDAQGQPPSARDCAHILYRTLIEGGAPEVMVVAPRPSPYTYDELLDMVEALHVVRLDSSGAAAGVGLLAFWTYQLLIEHKRYDDVVADARGMA